MNSLQLSHTWNVPNTAFQSLHFYFCFFFWFLFGFLFCKQKLPIYKILKIVGFNFYLWKITLPRDVSYCKEVIVPLLPSIPLYIIKILFLGKFVFICVLHKSIIYGNNWYVVTITFSTDIASNKNLTQFSLCFS